MSSSGEMPSDYQLGPFVIKGKENLLVTPDGELVLLPKVMAMLLHLCRHSDQVISFDALNQAIWPNEVVGDNAIYNLVGQLRKALGDNARSPDYIQTVSKVGYRLLVEARPIEQSPSTKLAQLEVSAKRVSRNTITALLGGVAIALSFIAVVLFSPKDDVESTDYQRTLKLAYYQLYRGDSLGVTQAMDTFQQLAVTYPQFPIPKIELAYIYVRKAYVNPENRQLWLDKAKQISTDEHLGKYGQRLITILDGTSNSAASMESLHILFSQDTVLPSARLAFSQILLARGDMEAAKSQAALALEQCMDCPYVYRRFATTQTVLGEVEAGVDSFSHYQMLTHQFTDNPIENVGYVRLTQQKLKEMASWHSQNSNPEPLLSYQRNTLALFYLSLGRLDAAQAIIGRSITTSNQYFDLYTQAAIAGAKGELNTVYEILSKRQTLYPENKRFKLSVVYSLWQLGRYADAKRMMDNFALVPDYKTLPQSLPFSIWSVYAALLIKTGEAEKGETILFALEQQLKAGLSPGSQTGDIRLASVLALQGKPHQAIEQLNLAISQGWVSDFNHNWWYLQDSPFFMEIAYHETFNAAVARYHSMLEAEFGDMVFVNKAL